MFCHLYHLELMLTLIKVFLKFSPALVSCNVPTTPFIYLPPDSNMFSVSAKIKTNH